MPSDDPRYAIHRALGIIAGQCDGARDDDGVGFNGIDTHAGRQWAAMPAELWDDDLTLAAWDMLRKYRRQLANAGVDYDELPVPAGGNELVEERRVEARERARARAQQWRRTELIKTESYVNCDGIGERVVLGFPYAEKLVDEAREIPGRKYLGDGVSVYPFSSLGAVVDFADRHQITVPDEVRGLIGLVTDQVYVARGGIVIDVPWNEATRALNADLRQFNNGTSTWDADNRVHRPPFRADPAGLAELIDGYGLSVSDEARALLDARVQANLAGVTATELNDAIAADSAANFAAAHAASADAEAEPDDEVEVPHPDSGAVERVPAKPEERIAANLAAIRVRNQVIAEGRAATAEERQVLARWSSWGAVPKIFADPAEGYNPAEDIYAAQRAQLRDLLTDAEYEAARRTTINAHYTSPALVEAIWGGLRELGFEGGQVLEPGCGSGNFIAAAPEQMQITGVELDPVTADIAALQYPDAHIVNASFAEARNSGGGFDAAVGNVPFSSVRLFDPRSNSGNHAMHNHAILWSLDNVRAGGLVAVLTSRYTMDAKDHSARAEMARMADLVAAVRLPSGAHRRTAGTDTVTDLLVFRKREKYLDKAKDLKGIPWLHAFNGNKALPLPDGLSVNQIFLPPEEQGEELQDQDRGADSGTEVQPGGPGRVLGVLMPGTGEAGRAELEVRGSTRDLPQRLADALSQAAAAAREDGLTWSPRVHTTKRSGKQQADLPPQLYVPDKDADRFEGMITAHDDGTFTVMEDGAARPWHCPNSQAAELRHLLRLRDQVIELREAERATTSDTPEIVEQRRVMNAIYDDYAATYGPLNRCDRVRSGRVDDDGEEIWQRRFPGQGGFRNDPFAWWVYALEDYEESTGEATKSEVFTKRVVEATHRPASAQTPVDALTVCLDESQEIRLERVAELLDLGSNAEARQALGELVFDDPRTGRLVPAAEYLSGNVREKLRHAEAAAAGEPVAHDGPDEARAMVGEALRDALGFAGMMAPDADVDEIVAVATGARGSGPTIDGTDDGDRGYVPDYSVNVTALQKVMPKEMEPGDITVTLESANAWVPARYVQQFLRETFQDPGLRATRSAGSAWDIKVQQAPEDLLEYEWGTKDHPAHKLVRSILEGRAIRVNPVYPSTDRKPEQQIRAERRRARQQAAVETAEIRAKAEQLNNAFAEWLWLDPKRCQTCLELYNEKFNSLRPRSFDDAELSLPGLSKEFHPDPHQIAAVARFLAQPGTLLGHVVGAGKTASMVMAAMEMRRLGMATKPGFMVPNHLVEQFAREFVRLYPQARIHVIDPKDLTAARRKQEVAKIGAQDWDAVIIPESVFVRIPMSAAEQERYVQEKTAEYRRDLERKRAMAVESGNKEAEKSVKKAEARLLAAQERWRKQSDRARDAGISFEQTGINFLFVDEAQSLKNLYFHTNNADLAIEGSARAADVDMKLAYLRRAGRMKQVVPKTVGLATGTPVTNSISELWTMMRFCIPEQLEAAGIDTFDAFCAQFCAREEVPELAPEGGIQIKERITRYRNVQQLLLLWLSFADIKTAADLNLPTPELAGDGPINHVIVSTVEDQVHRHELADRADEVRSGSVEPEEDNMLAITTDGRKAALDLRLTDMVPSRPGKLITAASEYARVYHENQNLTVPGPDGEQTLPGVFQFVFADLGTPSDQALREGRWILYEEFRLLAAEHGVPYDKTRFIHEARNAVEKENLFAQARRAQIAGLVGSTQKMGTGVNAQKYAKALHHLDQTYRPDWYTQRNGRILRRGNIFFDLGVPIEIHNYLLEGSFDAYMAQLNERKKTFIDQVITGRITGNEIEEIAADTVFSPTEIKALASGDDRMLKKAQLDAQVNKLRRLESAHRRNQLGLRNKVTIFESNINDLRQRLDRLENARSRAVPTRGDAFAMTIHDPDTGDTRYDKRTEAAEALHRMWITKATQMQKGHLTSLSLGPIAELGGFTLRATLKYEQKERFTDRLDVKRWFEYTATFNLDGIPDSQFEVTVTEFDPDSPKPAASAITQAENKVNGLDKQHATWTSQVETLEQQRDAAKARIGQPFPQAGELAEAKREADRLGEEIRNDTDEHHDRGVQDLLAQMTGPFTETYSGDAALQTAVATARQHADVDGIAYLSVHRDPGINADLSNGEDLDRVTVSMLRPDGPYAVTVADGSWRLFDGDPTHATLLDGPPDEQIRQRLMLASEHAASRTMAPLYGRVITTVRGARGMAIEVNQPIIAVWDTSADGAPNNTAAQNTGDGTAENGDRDAASDESQDDGDTGDGADQDAVPVQWVTVADGAVWVVSPGTSPTIYNPDSPALPEALRAEVDTWIAQAAENLVGGLGTGTDHEEDGTGEPGAGSTPSTLPDEPVREVLTALATATTAGTALLRARPIPATAETAAGADAGGWLVTFVRAGGEQVDCTLAPDGVPTALRINYDGGDPEPVPLSGLPPDGAEATAAWLLTAAPPGRATGKPAKARGERGAGRGRTQRTGGPAAAGPEQAPRQTSIPAAPDSTADAGRPAVDREPADEPTEQPAHEEARRDMLAPSEQAEDSPSANAAPAESHTTSDPGQPHTETDSETPAGQAGQAGQAAADAVAAPGAGPVPFGSREEIQRHHDALHAAWRAWADTATGDDLLNWDTSDPVHGELWAAELAQNAAQAWGRLTGFAQRTSPAARQSVLVAYTAFRDAAGHVAGNLRPARSDAGPPDPSADVIDRVVALADEHIERLSVTPLPQPDPHIRDKAAERARAALAGGGSYRRTEQGPVDRDVFQRALYSDAVGLCRAAAGTDGRGRVDPARRLICAEVHGVDLYIGLDRQGEEPIIALGFDELDLPQIRYTLSDIEAASPADLLAALEDYLLTGLDLPPEAADSARSLAEPVAADAEAVTSASGTEPASEPAMGTLEAAGRGDAEGAGEPGELYLLTHGDGVAQYVAGPELYRYLHDLAYAIPDQAAVDVSEEGRLMVLAPSATDEVEFSAELWHDGITRIHPVSEADLERLPDAPEPAAGTEPSWAHMQREVVVKALTDTELEAELDGELMSGGWMRLEPLKRWYARSQARGDALPRDGADATFDDVWTTWSADALPILEVMTLVRLRNQAQRRAARNSVPATSYPGHEAEQRGAEPTVHREQAEAVNAADVPVASGPEPRPAPEHEPETGAEPGILAAGTAEPHVVTPDEKRWAVRLGPYTTAADLVAGHRAVFRAHQQLRRQLRHVRMSGEAEEQTQALASAVSHLVEALRDPETLPTAVAEVRQQTTALAGMVDSGRTEDVPERQVAHAAEAHAARLYACTPQERADLAAAALELFDSGAPTPATADPVGLNPQPYGTAEELTDGFERLRAAAAAWLPTPPDRSRKEAGLVDALAAALAVESPPGPPNLAWMGDTLTAISDAAYARLSTASEPAWGQLATIGHESWQIASRLKAHEARAAKLYGYPSVVDAAAGGEQLVAAITAWRETSTSRSLPPGQDIDVDTTVGMLGLSEAEAANTPDSHHAWRNRMLTLAHDAYGLLVSLPSDQFATPDDAQVLRKLVTGAYRQASRIGNTAHIDRRAAYAAPIQAALAAPVPDPANLQPGHLLITHGATGTHVYGSGPQDHALHALLKKRGHDFDFYGREGYWFVKPRGRAFNDRGDRVRKLCQALKQPLDGTSWTVHVVFTDQRPDTIEIPERPAFTTRREADQALNTALSAYTTMTAENTWSKLRYQDRLDVDRVEQAYRRLPQPHARISLLDTDPDMLIARVEDWAKAARALEASLSEQNYRAPKLRPLITQTARRVEELAGRLRATVNDQTARTAVFGNEPAAAASTSRQAEAPDEANDFEHDATDATTGGGDGGEAGPHAPIAAPGGPPPELPDHPPQEEFTSFAQRLGLGLDTWRSAAGQRETIDVRMAQGYGADVILRREPDGDLRVPGLGPVTGTQAGRLVRLLLAHPGLGLEELFARATTDTTSPPVPARDAATGDDTAQTTPTVPTVPAGGPRTLETTEPTGGHEERGPVPSLATLRELAEAYDLRVRGTYAGGRLYLQLCEPATGRASPVVDIDIDAGQASGGPYPVALESIDAYLRDYRAHVPAEWFALEPENPRRSYIEYEWRRRLADLAPYIPPGEHHRADVAEHVGHAVQAAREGHATDADTLLARAEEALGTQWVMAASRQAVCLPLIDQYAVSLAWTGDVGRYVAEHLANVAESDRHTRPDAYIGDVGDKVTPLEEAWIGHQLRTFDPAAVSQPPPTMDARAKRDRDERARVQARMKQISDDAGAAKRAGDHDRALRLLDMGEAMSFAFTDGTDLAMAPGRITWDEARADVLAARESSSGSTVTGDAPDTGADAPASAEPGETGEHSSPDVPTPLNALGELRTIATELDLQVTPLPVAGQLYITVHEPDIPTVPVLTYQVRSAHAVSGPVRVAYDQIESWLRSYRTIVPREWFSVDTTVPHWPQRVVALAPRVVAGTLAPHMLDSGHHSSEVRYNLTNAYASATAGHHDDALAALERAEAADGGPRLGAERIALIDDALAHGNVPHDLDEATSRAESALPPPVLARERPAITTYVQQHAARLTTGAPDREQRQDEAARERDTGFQRAQELARRAEATLAESEYDAALQLLNEAELNDPHGNWETRRAQVRSAAKRAAARQGRPERSDSTSGEAQQSAASSAPDAAAEAPQAQAPSQGGADDGYGTATQATKAETSRQPDGPEPAAESHQTGDVPGQVQMPEAAASESGPAAGGDGTGGNTQMTEPMGLFADQAESAPATSPRGRRSGETLDRPDGLDEGPVPDVVPIDQATGGVSGLRGYQAWANHSVQLRAYNMVTGRKPSHALHIVRPRIGAPHSFDGELVDIWQGSRGQLIDRAVKSQFLVPVADQNTLQAAEESGHGSDPAGAAHPDGPPFRDLDQVRRYLGSGADPRVDPHVVRPLAELQRLAGHEDLELVSGGSFLIGPATAFDMAWARTHAHAGVPVDAPWMVWHTLTGSRIAIGLTDRQQALETAAGLAAITGPDGARFDWDAPDIAERFPGILRTVHRMAADRRVAAQHNAGQDRPLPQPDSTTGYGDISTVVQNHFGDRDAATLVGQCDQRLNELADELPDPDTDPDGLFNAALTCCNSLPSGSATQGAVTAACEQLNAQTNPERRRQIARQIARMIPATDLETTPAAERALQTLREGFDYQRAVADLPALREETTAALQRLHDELPAGRAGDQAWLRDLRRLLDQQLTAALEADHAATANQQTTADAAAEEQHAPAAETADLFDDVPGARIPGPAASADGAADEAAGTEAVEQQQPPGDLVKLAAQTGTTNLPYTWDLLIRAEEALPSDPADEQARQLRQQIVEVRDRLRRESEWLRWTLSTGDGVELQRCWYRDRRLTVRPGESGGYAWKVSHGAGKPPQAGREPTRQAAKAAALEASGAAAEMPGFTALPRRAISVRTLDGAQRSARDQAVTTEQPVPITLTPDGRARLSVDPEEQWAIHVGPHTLVTGDYRPGQDFCTQAIAWLTSDDQADEHHPADVDIGAVAIAHADRTDTVAYVYADPDGRVVVRSGAPLPVGTPGVMVTPGGEIWNNIGADGVVRWREDEDPPVYADLVASDHSGLDDGAEPVSAPVQATLDDAADDPQADTAANTAADTESGVADSTREAVHPAAAALAGQTGAGESAPPPDQEFLDQHVLFGHVGPPQPDGTQTRPGVEAHAAEDSEHAPGRVADGETAGTVPGPPDGNAVSAQADDPLMAPVSTGEARQDHSAAGEPAPTGETPAPAEPAGMAGGGEPVRYGAHRAAVRAWWRLQGNVAEAVCQAACSDCDRPVGEEHIVARGSDAENKAVEDALDHAWPGWRDQPVVEKPRGQMTKSQQSRWAEQVRAVYPPGWVDAGGPIITWRDGAGHRHVPEFAPGGGYDVACIRGFDQPTRFRPASEIPAPPVAIVGEDGPPLDQVEPLAAHTGWGGDRRPERLLYQDGTDVTLPNLRTDVFPSGRYLTGVAAGSLPAPDGSGRWQVIRVVTEHDTPDDGEDDDAQGNDAQGNGQVTVRHIMAHPAIIRPHTLHADHGRSESDHQRWERWELFDRAEAAGATSAYLPTRLLEVGDVIHATDELGVTEHGTRTVEAVNPRKLSKAPKGAPRFTEPWSGHVRVDIPDHNPILDACITAVTPADHTLDRDEQPPVRAAAGTVADVDSGMQPGLFEVEPAHGPGHGQATDQDGGHGQAPDDGAPSTRPAVSQPGPDGVLGQAGRTPLVEPDAVAERDAADEEEARDAGSEDSQEPAGSAAEAPDAVDGLDADRPGDRRAGSTQVEPGAGSAPVADRDAPDDQDPGAAYAGQDIPDDTPARPDPEPTQPVEPAGAAGPAAGDRFDLEAAHSTPNLRSEHGSASADSARWGEEPVAGEAASGGRPGHTDGGRTDAGHGQAVPETGTEVPRMPTSETSEKPSEATGPARDDLVGGGVIAALTHPPTVTGLGISDVHQEAPQDDLPARIAFRLGAPEGIRRSGWVSAEPDRNLRYTVHLTDTGLPDGSITELESHADARSLTNVIAAQVHDAHRLLAVAAATQIDGDPAEADTLVAAIEHAERRAFETASPQYLWLAARASDAPTAAEAEGNHRNAWMIGPFHPAHPGRPGDRIRVEPDERAGATWRVQLDQHAGHHGIDGRIDRRLLEPYLFAPGGGIDYARAHRLVDQTVAEDLSAILSLTPAGREATARYSSTADAWSVALADPADPRSTLQVFVPPPGARYPVMRNGVWVSALPGVSGDSDIVDVVEAVIDFVGAEQALAPAQTDPAQTDAEQARPAPAVDGDTPRETDAEAGSSGGRTGPTTGPADADSQASSGDFIQAWNRQAIQRRLHEMEPDAADEAATNEAPDDSADTADADEDPAQKLAEQARRAPNPDAVRQVWHDAYSAGLLDANVTVHGEEHQLHAYLETRAIQLGATPRSRPERQDPSPGAAPTASSSSRSTSSTDDSTIEPVAVPTPPQDVDARPAETRQAPVTLDAAEGPGATGSTPRARLVEAHAHAVAFYREQLFASQAEPVRRYLSDPPDAEPKGRNIGHVLEPDSVWQVGYAPNRPNALTKHLQGVGFTADELIDAGLSRRPDDGRYAGELIDHFRDRIMFPVRHPDTGECVGFTARQTPTNTYGGKWINSPATPIFDKGKLLYGLYEGRTNLEAGCAPVICEGPGDAIPIDAARRPGDPVPVAALGVRFTAEHAAVLGQVANPSQPAVVCTDADRPGRLAAPKVGRELGKVGFEPVYVPDMPAKVKDLGDLAGDHERIRAVVTDRSRGIAEAEKEAERLRLYDEVDQIIRSAKARARRDGEDPDRLDGDSLRQVVEDVAFFTSAHPLGLQAYGHYALQEAFPPPDGAEDQRRVNPGDEYRRLMATTTHGGNGAGGGPRPASGAEPAMSEGDGTGHRDSAGPVLADRSSTIASAQPGAAADEPGSAHGETRAAQNAAATDGGAAAEARGPFPASPWVLGSGTRTHIAAPVALSETEEPMSYPTVPGAPPPPYSRSNAEHVTETAGTRQPAGNGTGRRGEPPLRFPPPRPYDPKGSDAEERLDAASQLVAARLSRAVGRGQPIPSRPELVAPVLEQQCGFDHATAVQVAQHAWARDWTSAEEAVTTAARINQQLAAAEPRQQAQQAQSAGLARVDASRPPQDTHPVAQALEQNHEPPAVQAAAAPAERATPYPTRAEAEAQSARINGLLQAAVLAVKSAGLDRQDRPAAELVRQLRDVWEPMDQRGIADGPRKAQGRYQQMHDIARRLDQQVGAELASGQLTRDGAEYARWAREDLRALVGETYTHVHRLRATADPLSAQPFDGRGPAEHASSSVAMACNAWVASPLGDDLMNGVAQDDHAEAITEVRGAWQDIYQHGLNGGAAEAAPRFERLAHALYALEEDVLSTGTASAAGIAGGDRTQLLHEAADRALAVSQRLQATGMRHAWHGNRRQARRWERHHDPVAGLPSRLSDRTTELLNRVRGGAIRRGTGGTRAGDAARASAGAADRPGRGIAGRVAGLLPPREGDTR